MKRMLVLLLVMLLLAGCAVTEPPAGTEDTTVPTQTTEPPVPGLYAPDSALEQQTAGVVRAYPLDGDCNGLLLMGDKLLLYYLDEQMRINVYTGDELNLEIAATHHLLLPSDGQRVQATGQNLSYYNPGNNTLVILDDQLREKYSVSLPVEIQGVPVVNKQMDTVYYGTSEGIRAMNLETGIAHLLRHQENFAGSLHKSIFDSELLVCVTINSDGSTTTEFVQAENGLQVGKDPYLQSVESYGDLYFLRRSPENATIYQFGNRDGNLQVFAPADDDAEVICALELGGVLTVKTAETSVTLDLYDLETGLRTSSVTLEGVTGLREFTADPRGYVWFLSDHNVLCRWEVSLSPAADETIYTTPWYTSDEPNADGLAQCQAEADAIALKYGVEIRLWEDAVEAPWEAQSTEFRVEIYEDMLPLVDRTLARFPEGFLAQLGEICDSGAITISLVGDSGNEPGCLEWVNGDAHIALELGEHLETELLRMIYRVMDTYILGENSMLDQWDADKPAEDRGDLFVEAMTAENQEYFEKSSVQGKLRTLCRAIRDAFGLKKYGSELPWEQYLENPLY